MYPRKAMDKLKSYEDMDLNDLKADLIDLGFMHSYKVWIEMEIHPKKNNIIRDTEVLTLLELEITISSQFNDDIFKAAMKKIEAGQYKQNLDIDILNKTPKLKVALGKNGYILNHPGSYYTIEGLKEAFKKEIENKLGNKGYWAKGKVQIEKYT